MPVYQSTKFDLHTAPPDAARACRRGDRITVQCCICSRPLMARSGGSRMFALAPLSGAKRTTFAHYEYSRFSNRPFEVKRFQTIHHDSVDVAHGLVLLYGIGTKALPLWDSKTRWSDLMGGLTVRLTVGPSGCANSPHPSSREGHHSTARWSSSFLLSRLIPP